MAKNDYLWLNMAIMPAPLNIYVLDYPGALASAKYGVYDLFTIANYQADQELFTCRPLTASVEPVKGRESIIFIPPSLAKELPSFSDPETLSLLKSWHHSGAVLVAACAGVFWLANTRLLDGKQATTHWLLCDDLAANNPLIEGVRKHEMVVDQGDIVTAAGLYAFQDLALHLIARFAGFALAKKVADFSLLDLKGRLQAYYQRFYPVFTHGDSVIVKAQKLCSEQLYSSITIMQLAEHCHLSPRTLLRRFKLATGYSPKQYIIQLRVEKAKQLMELEKISIEEIGYKLGYTDTSNFIKIFKKVVGVTPAEFQSRQTI